MVGVPGGAPEVGVLAGEGDEVHVEFGTVLGIIRRKGDYGGGAGGIVVGSGVEDLAPEIAQMVVMGGEDIAAVVARALHLRYHVEALVVLQELVLYLGFQSFGVFRETVGHPGYGLVYDLLAIGLVELEGLVPGEEYACVRGLPVRLQAREIRAVPV